MSRSRYKIFEEEYPYFLTSTVVAWLPLFSQPWTVDILYDSFRWLQKERQVSIFG
jgi:putative transposase